jgi:glycosyltransferase involved in cell wall biosynthesis
MAILNFAHHYHAYPVTHNPITTSTEFPILSLGKATTELMYKELTLYSIVIPVYCEEYHLKLVLETIEQEISSLASCYEIILIDDGSTDNTWDVIREISVYHADIKALRFSRNFGKDYALYAGLETAKGEVVIVMDGDLQHPPQLIPKMLKVWSKSNVDIVEAVKVSRGKESFLGKLRANLFYAILNRLSGYNLRGASDYKLLDRRVVDAWLRIGERNLFFRGMTAWLGFRSVQISFEVPNRVGGKSQWSILQLVKLALTGITSFSSLPLHFVTLSGLTFLVFSFVLGFQSLFLKFTGQSVSGFTTVILLLLIIGSLLMLSLGMIGIYIARIYEEVKRRPRYVVLEKIEKTHTDVKNTY